MREVELEVHYFGNAKKLLWQKTKIFNDGKCKEFNSGGKNRSKFNYG